MERLFTSDACGDNENGPCSQDNRCHENSDGNFVCSPIVKTQGRKRVLHFQVLFEIFESLLQEHILHSEARGRVIVQERLTVSEWSVYGQHKMHSVIKLGASLYAQLALWRRERCRQRRGQCLLQKSSGFYRVSMQSDHQQIRTLFARTWISSQHSAPRSRPNGIAAKHRRGLSCKSKKSSHCFVCKLRTHGGYARSGCKYSKCLPEDCPRKCYVARYSGIGYKVNWQMYLCNPNTNKVPLGFPSNCSDLNPNCRKSAKCERIDGILEIRPSMGGSRIFDSFGIVARCRRVVRH